MLTSSSEFIRRRVLRFHTWSKSGQRKGALTRRTLLLFVLCAVLPILIAGVVTIERTTNYFTHQANRTLTENAKSFGLQLFERLRLADRALNDIEPQGLHRLIQANLPADEHRYFNAIAMVGADGLKLLAGDAQALPDSEIDRARIERSTSRQRLWAQQDRNGKLTVYLGHRIQSAAGTMIIAALDDDYLWQPVNNSALYAVCVTNNQSSKLYCTEDTNEGDAAAPESEYSTGEWSLFLKPGFGAADWKITTLQPRAFALAPVQLYKRTLVVALLGVLALVMLLSSITIRRSHKPLAQIISATRRIADGHFDTPLSVNSGDEYEELSQAFNVMSDQLARQFRTLSVFGEIDRFILESPNLEPIVETLLTQARGLLTCDFAAVALFDGEKETLGRLYSIGGESRKPQLSRMGWPIASVLRDGSDQTGYIVTTTGHGHSTLEPLWILGAHQCLLIPVITKTVMHAVLILGYREIVEVEPAQRQLARDLSDRLAVALTSAEREQALFEQAHYDSLTQLPNRLLFKDRLEVELVHARRDASSVTLLFIDLDRFKQINDSLGHTAGDQLLKLAANRFAIELRDIDTIARLGGDEFTVIAPQLRAPADISRLCERLLRSLTRPFVIGGHEFYIGASIGIALFPNNGADAEELLRNADTAMYRAKSKSRGTFAFYEESMNQEIQERTVLESQLRQALSQNQLTLYYQPKVDLASGKVVGAEALIRWNHPEHGMIDPAKFIPIAEDTGLIVPIGEWVIDSACAQLRSWRHQGINLHSISANVSVPQLHAKSFVERVQQIMHAHQMQAGMLELELTESTLATDIEATAEILSRLSKAGVQLAIDDFGTGYSSLSYLQRLPIDVLKIDRAFMPVNFDGNDHLICEAVLALARTLGKTVVAEGVENAEQMLYLQSHGCHIGQGWFFGKAIPGEEFTARFKYQNAPDQQVAIGM